MLGAWRDNAPGAAPQTGVFAMARLLGSRQQVPAAESARTNPAQGSAAGLLVQEWLPLCRRLKIPSPKLPEIAESAVRNDTGFLIELLASGLVDEAETFRALADELGLDYLEAIDPKRLILLERHGRAALGTRHGLPLAMIERPNGGHLHILARADISLAGMRARLSHAPGIASRLRVAAPSTLRAAIITQSREELLFGAQHDLFVRMPEFSARNVINGWQGACVGFFLVGFPLCVLLDPTLTLLLVQAFASVAFLACVLVRVLALGVARPLRLPPLRPVVPSDQPVYSVLIALYKEREVVPQLLTALGKLQWPRSKLEIKLVCEADDHETLTALRSQKLRPWVEVVEVPPGLPRTKPKALNYALPLCSGEFVTLYDAEDRPHPLQLVEAWQRFRQDGDDLACVQAPLVVTNASASFFSRMFAFEYSGLFRGLLPMLSRYRLVLPLGGTSNHFRRSALIEVGGWDGYNVTEDADLSLRLKRLGYRTSTIEYPTLEDGPEELLIWMPQRVRWFKGWIQTWLVHMRSPRYLLREIGLRSFLMAQILFAGMIVSAMVHPILVATVLYMPAKLAWTGSLAFTEALAATIGLSNIVIGYGAFILLGWLTLTLREKASLIKIVAMTPLYWMLLSVAAWWAVWEIYRRPHHWNKTPHRQVQSPPSLNAERREAASLT